MKVAGGMGRCEGERNEFGGSQRPSSLLSWGDDWCSPNYSAGLLRNSWEEWQGAACPRWNKSYPRERYTSHSRSQGVRIRLDYGSQWAALPR